MYAIMKTGGKQYRVTEGQILKIDKLTQDIGSLVEFNEVLLFEQDNKLHIGSPKVRGAKVVAEIVNKSRATKINIIKFKRRKHHMKRMGHRQHFTAVKVVGIILDDKEEKNKKENNNKKEVSI
ncbi:50S ribosomal protein L21 [Coxiella endosymbiont of Amblyomma americanum]|uniref:50S ribosomal protein L21 n=1 Tax=Coxiella endosymbiont of Amblyomma americanum TaxID=325775 RepID=UPI00057FC447|nr:50S ribosomal protein L21 [Coxiella endosymbiont of Amblyomma americanum]AJC50480.1 50S ribosomal protein L21 [Coxiella endosymbiont of Amblyomma americanum]AUJ58819.1 50S ribosomal protein L21 [Coxiella-like endosymbiont of Amblyomma americanum]